MDRSITNMIRWGMDELLPACIRDSKLFMWPFYCLAYKTLKPSRYMNFKSAVFSMSSKEYSEFYSNLNSVSRNRKTDNNTHCIKKLLDDCEAAKSVLDVGCGHGYLLSLIHDKYPSKHLVGVDLLSCAPYQDFKYVRSPADSLPFNDSEFDMVCCTHVIEHIVNPDNVMDELIRVARKTVVVVTPKQRPFYYTLDEHVNFFFYAEQLRRLVSGMRCDISNVHGDWYMVVRK